MSMTNYKFYFFSTQKAIRFHISRKLLARGWEKATSAKEAIFADANLTLNDEILKHFEYKHLLAQLMEKAGKALMPLTYNINDDNCNEVFAKIIYTHYLTSQDNDLKWILKPSMLNNGDHIKLFSHIEEVKKHYASSKRLGGEHVLQQYITNPALIAGRKFTFRMPVVLTNYAGVFLYKEGYINISALPFTLTDGFKDRKAHITNYVLDEEFANIEQRSTQTLENFSDQYQQMSVIVKACVKDLLKRFPYFLKPQKTKIFEIFGFDFMLDATGKIWLLEINQGPDAPTFEENCLDEIFWHKFWEDIIQDFVLPIAFNTPQREYKNFSRLLSSHQCFSHWRYFW